MIGIRFCTVYTFHEEAMLPVLRTMLSFSLSSLLRLCLNVVAHGTAAQRGRDK
jgi:hypothetical protein